ERITVAHFVPSLLRPLLEEPSLRECADLRAVFCGGEGMGRELHDRFFEVLPGRTLAHFYGPTEAAISTLFHDCGSDEPPGALPLGLPIANADVRVLDATLHPAPEGIPGEIYIGGHVLARGYLGRADLTAERFVPDPAATVPGARLYRTGDVGRRRTDGAIVFQGRADRQIKIRGHRIEPGEIESALARLPGVEQAVVVPHGEGDGRHLAAYLACPGGVPEESEIRAHLRRSLPEPMVPSAFVALGALPLGPNGKIDLKALPEPRGRAAPAGSIAPRTDAARVIAGIWEGLLRREGVGVEDDFFDLGGDSLLATQVVSRLRAAFEVNLPLRRFFEGATVAALAEKVEELLVEKLESMSEEEVVRLLDRESRPSVRSHDGS